MSNKHEYTNSKEVWKEIFDHIWDGTEGTPEDIVRIMSLVDRHAELKIEENKDCPDPVLCEHCSELATERDPEGVPLCSNCFQHLTDEKAFIQDIQVTTQDIFENIENLSREGILTGGKRIEYIPLQKIKSLLDGMGFKKKTLFN